MRVIPINDYLLFAALTLAPLAASASQEAPSAPPQGVWETNACPFDSGRALLPVTCGRLRVPENYANPAGRSIEVAVMIVRARRNIDPGNPVIFLSGGPGSPALVHVETLVTTPAIREIVVDRDWVFFDQRGGGRSNPALFCQESEDWFESIKACRNQFLAQGVDLSQYNSARIAADMEALRRALGVTQWNVWGASYGARLAMTVARYYPSSVHSVVVDGPYLPEDQERVEDLRGAEVMINRLFSKCAADSACSSRFPQLRSRFIAALPRLRQEPLTVGEERFNDYRVANFVVDSLYGGAQPTFEQRIQRVLAYMDAAARGDGRLMLQIEQRMASETPARPELPNQARWQTGQNLSIDCHEEKPFESMDEYAQAAARSEIVRSLLGPEGGRNSLQACALWGAGRAERIENTHVDYDGPILALSGELDPTLSGIAGFKIEMLYANARHVVFRNAGHVQFYIRSYNYSAEERPYRLCALELGRQFIADPRRRLDTRCAETRQVRLVQ